MHVSSVFRSNPRPRINDSSLSDSKAAEFPVEVDTYRRGLALAAGVLVTLSPCLAASKQPAFTPETPVEPATEMVVESFASQVSVGYLLADSGAQASETAVAPTDWRSRGREAVATARRYLGTRSDQITGLEHYTAAGGASNNCADFVSAVLQEHGMLKHHYVSVARLRQGLVDHGYQRISGSQAEPGDVWISPGGGHVELVTESGGGRLIGSNNNGRSFQTISERGVWASGGHYYQL